jgi:hypothetical protein
LDGAFGLFLTTAVGCATTPTPAAMLGFAAPDNRPYREQWGVEVVGIRQSAAGHMLDFRYRVVDPVKAAPLFARRTKPVLLHERSGTRFVVPTPPTTGPLRSSNTPQAGRTYFMFFSNPGGFVKPGDRITVEIGEFRAPHLEVR